MLLSVETASKNIPSKLDFRKLGLKAEIYSESIFEMLSVMVIALSYSSQL